MNEDLLDALDGAKLVKIDRETGILIVWKGGYTINGYDYTGRCCAVWSMGNTDDTPTLDDAEASIESHMAEQYYPC